MLIKNIKLTKEDKRFFKDEIKRANQEELLAVIEFIKNSHLSKQDKKYCFTHIGMRGEKMLRNAVKNIIAK